MSESSRPFDRLDYLYKLLVVITLSVVAVILARDIFIPLAFAALLSIVMLPFVKRMEKVGIPTAMAISIVLLITVALLITLVWMIVNQVINLINDLPDLQVRFEDFLNQMSRMARRDFNISKTEQNKMVSEVMQNIRSYLGDVLITTTST